MTALSCLEQLKNITKLSPDQQENSHLPIMAPASKSLNFLQPSEKVQQTLQHSIILEGPGLHSNKMGEHVSVT